IISKDKDLKQLLEGRHAPPQGTEARRHEGGKRTREVELYDIHTDELITEASFKTETGLTPAQVVDMLALMGDNVDNVPGVEGVGPKTAAQLIAQYGTLENLLKHAHEVKGKRGEALRATAGVLGLSQQLVTLRRDVPVEFGLEEAK